MKIKKYVHGVTFFISPEMFQDLKGVSDELQISVSELLRELIATHLITLKGDLATTGSIRNKDLR
jgi:hypothetical protein